MGLCSNGKSDGIRINLTLSGSRPIFLQVYERMLSSTVRPPHR